MHQVYLPSMPTFGLSTLIFMYELALNVRLLCVGTCMRNNGTRAYYACVRCRPVMCATCVQIFSLVHASYNEYAQSRLVMHHNDYMFV